MARPNLFLRSQQGLTLLELLVTVVVSSVILGVSLGLIVTQRRQYISQQATTDVNQTIQSSMDLIGADVRQTGEKVGLGLGLPVIRIMNGSGTAPDTLVLQRKLLTQDLTVCAQVDPSSTSIRVVDKAEAVSQVGCRFTDGPPANGLPDNVEEWKAYRCQLATKPACASPPGDCKQTTPASLNDECSWAYIHNPMTGKGEFFLYSGEAQEGPAVDQRYLINKSTATPITKTYPEGSKLYILEERRYALGEQNVRGDRILELSLVDRDTNTIFNNAPLQIVNRLRDFQVKGIDTTGAEIDAFNVNDPPTFPYGDWTALKAIKVSVSVENIEPDAKPIIQTLTSQFFPRNSLSRPTTP